MIKRQKLIGIVASVVLAALGTTLLVAFVKGAEDRALEGEEAVSVLVARDTIPKGTKAEDISGKVKLEQVPAKVVAKGAIGSMTPVAGQVTVVDVLAGEQLVQGRFANPSDAQRLDIPPGMLQVTVSVDPVRAIGGQIRNGDSIGVLASFEEPETTHLVLQKVRVTDVRTDGGVPVTSPAEGNAPTGKLLVTMALDAPSVEKVVFAAEHGRLWLSLQPLDANEGGTKVQTKAAVNL